ncbi:MAG: hypothetical protein NWE93_05995 [Candidatus Bathyarchaeota archaeon]|nr:hypothetical protein [Candidatus Bathyarchaeota archaeon]
MKTQAVLLALLMLTSIFGACLPIEAQPTLTPHEDPTATKSSIDAYSFLIEYADIFALMANRKYQNASDLSEQLSHITVPPDLSYIISRYNQLTQQLITTLSDLQRSLDTASKMLDQNRLSEVGPALDRAGVLVAKAQILLDDLKDATAILSQKIGVYAGAGQSKISEAYSQLQAMLQRLKDLIDLYHQLLQRANQREQEIRAQNLKATSLTLALNRTRCFVGGTITASGHLTAGDGLGSRRVELLLDGKQVTTATTGQDGAYSAAIKLPYRYVDSVSIYALYTPVGNDKESYLAAISSTIKVKVLYYKTLLEVSAPTVAYPGLSMTVSGKVTAQDGTAQSERQIKVYLDGALKAQGKTSLNGTCSIKFTVDASAKLGNHSLTVTAQASGLYAPAAETRSFRIQKMATYLQLDAPQFVLLPTQIQVTGTVKSATKPLSGATVQLSFINFTTAAKTASDGSFNITMDAPLNTALAGYQELTISAHPSEPWQAAAQLKANVLALNSVSTGLALASSLSVFAVAYMKLSKTGKKQMPILQAKEESSIETTLQKAPTTIPTLPQVKLQGARGAILQAYVEALAAVQSATGATLTINMTLREYTKITCPRIGAAGKLFESLTMQAEKSLYSPHTPQPEELQRAEEHKEAIRRILGAAK